MSLVAAASGRPLDPLEAYAALDEYVGRYGRAALMLTAHAAVPSSFRADLVNLIKLNFVSDARGDLAIDAALLFAPFAEALGGGFYRMESEVRRQCLALLD